MSMTLEEAIVHAEKVAEVNEKISLYTPVEFIPADLSIELCQNCAEEHRQLAEWLRELKERRKQPERKVGEWVQVPRFEGDAQPYLECPFCKHKVGWWDLARYCAGCGAKLKGGAG